MNICNCYNIMTVLFLPSSFSDLIQTNMNKKKIKKPEQSWFWQSKLFFFSEEEKPFLIYLNNLLSSWIISDNHFVLQMRKLCEIFTAKVFRNGLYEIQAMIDEICICASVTTSEIAQPFLPNSVEAFWNPSFSRLPLLLVQGQQWNNFLAVIVHPTIS